jgi:hypothetical protein
VEKTIKGGFIMKTYKLETRTVEIITLDAENKEQAKEMAVSGYSNNVRSMEFYIDDIEDITPTEKQLITKKEKNEQ